ncbi:uncharacterized protein KRP23_14902 [Phytophthora ramorum]|uniref:uncharacterized protein n=1 Tax=Phytophthora ramorum TaxID=164328 RepID=UPI0030B5AD63|nr:hypothetical protein KRP23_14902 [Phytophthora ramorum]
MKPTAFPSFTAAIMAVLLAAAPSSVNAHGQMTNPTPRPISQQYRADCGALSGAGDQELQYAPVELLSSRAQADRPAADTFNIMNGCRGTVYETNNTVTELTAGVSFDVDTDSSGTITYESVAELLTIDPFAETSGGNTSTTATIPTSVIGCGSAGDCALQFYWHSDLASQTYPTCADIVVTGSGSSGESTSMAAPAATTATPTGTTVAPAATTSSPTATTAPSTSSPANAAKTQAPSDSSTLPEKCTRRQRRV